MKDRRSEQLEVRGPAGFLARLESPQVPLLVVIICLLGFQGWQTYALREVAVELRAVVRAGTEAQQEAIQGREAAVERVLRQTTQEHGELIIAIRQLVEMFEQRLPMGPRMHRP